MFISHIGEFSQPFNKLRQCIFGLYHLSKYLLEMSLQKCINFVKQDSVFRYNINYIDLDVYPYTHLIIIEDGHDNRHLTHSVWNYFRK